MKVWVPKTQIVDAAGMSKRKYKAEVLVSGQWLCNALSNYLIILLDDMVYVYILYDFDDYVTYL